MSRPISCWQDGSKWVNASRSAASRHPATYGQAITYETAING
jgi:hypothetical protein